MPIPNYPHPTPDPNAATYNVLKPTGTEVNQLPDLGTLASNIQVWLNEIDPSLGAIKSWCDLTKPGTVLIVGNGEAAPGLPGYDRLEVLNGKVTNASYHGIHNTWKANNQKLIDARPKFKANNASADYLYLASDMNAVTYSQHRDHGGTTSGYTDSEGKRIFINAHSDKGDMLVHEYFHTCDPGDPSDIGWGMDEGMVDFFSRDVAKRFGYPYLGNGGYEGGYQVIKRLVDRVGLKLIVKLWFLRSELLVKTFQKITLAAAEFVKPGEEGQFNSRLGSLNPLIADFEKEGRAKFAADVTVART
jgi:hypothetical protein